MSKKRFRHELKYLINTFDYYSLKSKLSVALNKDSYSELDGSYKVSSIYFDNYEDKVLREKLDGLPTREKFRIRFYNDDFSLIRLEKKSKFNSLCLKEGATITEEELRCILNGDLAFLRYKEIDLCKELYAKMIYQQLRPRNLTSYTREAFTYPSGNVRITFDYDIRLHNNVMEILDGDAYSTPIDPLVKILEVKYDEFLPQIVSDIIQLKDRYKAEFSKYATARLARE